MPIETLDWDDRQLGWSDVLRTGIDNRQLRNALDRKITPIGRKHRSGWMFSLREWFMLSVAGQLTRVWLPISTALRVAEQVGPDLEAIISCLEKHQVDDAKQVPELVLHIFNMKDSVALSYALEGSTWFPNEDKSTGKYPLFSAWVSAHVAEAAERMLAFSKKELVLFSADTEWAPTMVKLS